MICSDKGHLVQKRFLPPVPKVLKPQRSGLCHERSSWRDLWEPLRVAVVGTQIDSSWILLAYYVEGCPCLCQSLRQMSKVRQHHQTDNRRTHPNNGPMTFLSMRVGHYGPIPSSNETAKVSNNRHRLLHQMGRSWSPGHHHREERAKLHLEEHNLQIWDP